MSSDQSIVTKEHFKNIAYIVEANSFEQLSLWQTWHNEKHIPWIEISQGLITTVGEFAEFPVCIEINFALICNQRVVFYYPTSEVVNWTLIKEWWKMHQPSAPHCNAMNFQNCISKLMNT